MSSHLIQRRVRVAAISLSTMMIAALTVLASPAPAAAQSSQSSNPVAQTSSLYLDELGRPTQYAQDRIADLAALPWLPEDISNALLTASNFFAGTDGDGGVPLPEQAPNFTQFYWPTVSGDCIDGGGNSVASAIAVPGPAEIPAPGAAEGQTAFVFTAMGTAPATEQQGGLHVHWLNLDTWNFGSTPLGNHGINPDGPATLSGVADTGKGNIVAVVGGDVMTETTTCSFIPTAAFIEAR